MNGGTAEWSGAGPGSRRPLAVVLGTAEVREQWVRRGVAVVRCGGAFGAVRVPAELVHAAAGTEVPAGVRVHLAATVRGPVVGDRVSGHFYPLVPARAWPPHQEAARAVPGARYLGPGAFLGVPPPGLTDPAAGRCYWAVPPDPVDGRSALCPPEAVARLLRTAHGSGA
ncbi:hypothetical protein JNUCC64_21370 [Streptomyces sp. JNUCC 64]